MAARALGTCLILTLAAITPSEAAARLQAAEAEARSLIDGPQAPGSLTRAIALLEDARGRGEEVGVLTLLAEAYYLQGHELDDRDRAVKELETAIVRADQALAVVPGHVPARYWRALSLLAKAGKLRGVESLGLVREAMREMEVVAAADPTLDNAGAHRAMGKVYLDSPMWFLGDTDKAIEQLETARRLAPHSLQTRRFLAAAYAEDGREEDALRELDELLRLPSAPGRAASEQEERDLARRLAERIRARLKKP